MIAHAGRIIFSRLFENEDLAESIKNTAKKNGVKAGFFMLIGSLKHATLGYYKEGQYQNVKLEVL